MNCVLCDVFFMKDCLQFEIYFTSTTHSNTLLVNFIRKILNWDLNVESHSRYLCKSCYDLLEELDFAELSCTRLRKQLSERCISNRYNNLSKDNCTQTYDQENDDKFNEFSETILETLKTEANNVGKTQNEEVEDESDNKTISTRGKKNKPYDCKVCQKKYSSKSGLQLHVNRQHSTDQVRTETSTGSQENPIKLECDVVIEECLKSEPDQSDSQSMDEAETMNSVPRTRLKGKKRGVASKVKPLKYSCPQCPKMWRTLGELRSHVATHSTLRPYICEVCGQAYKHKQALDIHVGMHNGINPFSCNFCHKAFTQKGALQRHLPIHTGEAPYQCDLCGKRFVHHTSFNMHTLAHTGQKSYKCNICGLALLSGSHLKRHMRVHTGERPYACSQCGKRFAERYNLAAHQRLHEAGPSEISRRLHRCQVCGAGFDRRPKLEEHLSNNHNKIAETDQSRKWVGHFLSNTG